MFYTLLLYVIFGFISVYSSSRNVTSTSNRVSVGARIAFVLWLVAMCCLRCC